MGAEPAWHLPRGPPGGILSVGPFVARAWLGLSSPPPALPLEVCPRLRSHSLGEGAEPPLEPGGLGITHSHLGLDARLEIINAINIHNARPGEMVRAIICSSPGLAPEDGQSGSRALTPQHRLGRRRRPPRGASCRAPRPLLNPAGSLQDSHQPVGGGDGYVSQVKDPSPRETGSPGGRSAPKRPGQSTVP